MRSVANEAAGLAGTLAAQTHLVGPISQTFNPILPISCELLGRNIGGVLIEQIGKGAKCAAKSGRPNTQPGVDIRQAPGDQRHSEPVHHDVMVACVPEEPIRRCFEQGVREQRSFGWINRTGQFGPHPCFGLGPRVRCIADVDERHGPRRCVADDLPRAIRVFDDPDAKGLGFDDDLA